MSNEIVIICQFVRYYIFHLPEPDCYQCPLWLSIGTCSQVAESGQLTGSSPAKLPANIWYWPNCLTTYDTGQTTSQHMILAKLPPNIWYWPNFLPRYDTGQTTCQHMIPPKPPPNIWYRQNYLPTYDISQTICQHMKPAKLPANIWYIPERYWWFSFLGYSGLQIAN